MKTRARIDLAGVGEEAYLRNDYREAAALAGDVIEVSPERGDAWLLLADCALADGRWNEALEHATKAMSCAATDDERRAGAEASMQAVVRLEHCGRLPAGSVALAALVATENDESP